MLVKIVQMRIILSGTVLSVSLFGTLVIDP